MALLLGVLPAASASEPAADAGRVIESLGAAFKDDDGDFFPDRLDDLVTVKGILTSDPLPMGGNWALANLQDATGAAMLFTRDSSLLTEGSYHAGDEVRRYSTSPG